MALCPSSPSCTLLSPATAKPSRTLLPVAAPAWERHVSSKSACRCRTTFRCAVRTTRAEHPAAPAKFSATPGAAAAAAVAAAAAAAALVLGSAPAYAELNRFEADKRGEFGIGSAAQYGSADLKGTNHKNENFRRANFTSADMREADFSGCSFAGGYLEKAVAYRTNFEGADFTDALMDRMVLNESNLKDAVLVRTVLTRSDLGKADIEGADFSDAVLDLPQKQALCKYAKGVNPSTGMSTRTSLGCSNKKGNAYGTPSAPALTGDAPKYLTKDGFCDDGTGLCKPSF